MIWGIGQNWFHFDSVCFHHILHLLSSHKKNVEIDWNWQELEEKDCKVIKEFLDQLDQKDNHYIKAMQTMSDDIEKLIKNMKYQY